MLRRLLRMEEYSHCNSQNEKSPLHLFPMHQKPVKGLLSDSVLAPLPSVQVLVLSCLLQLPSLW